MPTNAYESPLSSRYASDEMLYLFSADKKFSTWRRLWVALARAEMELGLPVTQEQVDELEAHITDIDYEKAAQWERKLRHDVMAHVHTYGELCPKAMPIIHLGATSCYVGDNTDVILMREGLELVRAKLVKVIARLAKFAEEYKALPTLGYTHYQPAQLVTVGKRATLWMNELLMDLEEVEHRISSLKLLGSKGTTGTQASFLELFEGDHGKVKELERRIAEEMGFDAFNVGPEAEFFLFQTDDEGKPTTRTNDEAGYFDLGPLDHGEGTRREICMALEQMGFEIEASHHECARGQHEIDFKYDEALDCADKIMTFKLAVKSLAQKNGLHATFMPKPLFGLAGSGMHINMSLFRDGKNIFFDEKGEKQLSSLAYSFIAGLLEHVKGFTALTNPLVNSYKRLVPGYEAPCYLAWSASNRSALIRIPAARGQSTRVELRSPDPACNPYLELAVCLAAGLDGIEKGLTPPPEVTENIFDMNAAARKAHGIDSLPDSLEEAIHALEADPLVLDTLGEHVAANYIEGKRKEWEEYRTRVSSWEREKYIINY